MGLLNKIFDLDERIRTAVVNYVITEYSPTVRAQFDLLKARVETLENALQAQDMNIQTLYSKVKELKKPEPKIEEEPKKRGRKPKKMLD